MVLEVWWRWQTASHRGLFRFTEEGHVAVHQLLRWNWKFHLMAKCVNHVLHWCKVAARFQAQQKNLWLLFAVWFNPQNSDIDEDVLRFFCFETWDSSFLLIDNGELLNRHLPHLALCSGSGSAGSYCSSAVPSTALIFDSDRHEFGSIVTACCRCGTPSCNFRCFFQLPRQ